MGIKRTLKSLAKQSYHEFFGLSARESCLALAALYCRMCVDKKKLFPRSVSS